MNRQETVLIVILVALCAFMGGALLSERAVAQGVGTKWEYKTVYVQDYGLEAIAGLWVEAPPPANWETLTRVDGRAYAAEGTTEAGAVYLNRLGEEGWELVTMTGDAFNFFLVLKRPMQ